MTNSFRQLIEQAVLLQQVEVKVVPQKVYELFDDIKQLEVQNKALREANERMAKKLRSLEP